MCIYIYIYLFNYTYTYTSTHIWNWSTGFLDYSLPQILAGFQRCSEIPIKTKQASSVGFVENRFLPFAPIGFRRKPEPVPLTQVITLLEGASILTSTLAIPPPRK